MNKPDKLPKLIGRLVEIEATDSPLISCFVNLEQARADYFTEIEGYAKLVGERLSGIRRKHYEDALAEIRDILRLPLQTDSKSIAIYARWGEQPLVLSVEFPIPMETEFIVDCLPHIYPLIELKDIYQRFIIVLTTETEARILETTIGAVTEGILARRPELRRRIGQEWTREHYQDHKRETTQKFLDANIELIDRLISKRGISYLVVTGSPHMVKRLTKALPQRLKERLISAVSSSPGKGIDPIVRESLMHVVAAEQVESHDRVERLEKAVLAGKLGVAGYNATAAALQGDYADVLIIDQDLDDVEMREELVRLAEKNGVEIETVGGSETLRRLSGVGCMLRYRPKAKGRRRTKKAA